MLSCAEGSLRPRSHVRRGRAVGLVLMQVAVMEDPEIECSRECERERIRIREELQVEKIKDA
jgi:hypothetical protein